MFSAVADHPEYDSGDGPSTSLDGTSHTAEQRLYQRKASRSLFHAARSFLNAKTTDLMARPAPPPPGHGWLGTILAGVSSWADPIRRRCERGNDPHQREEYA